MNNVAGYLIDFFNVLVEVWTSREIFKTFGPRRSDKKWSYILEGGMSLLMVSAIVYNRKQSRFAPVLFPCVFVFMVILNIAFYQTSVKIIIAWNSCWWMVIGWLELIGLMACSIIEQRNLILLNFQKPVTDYIYLIIISGVVIGVYKLWISSYIKNIGKTVSKYGWILIIMAILTFFVFIPYFMRLGYEIITMGYLLCASLVIISIILLCIVLCIYSLQIEEKAYVMQMALNTKNGEVQLEGYDRKTSDLNQKEHDFKHHLNYIYQCIKESRPEMAKTYIESLWDVKKDDSRQYIYTGIYTIDIILNLKIKLAKEKEIDVKTDIGVISCPLENADLCIVLSNIIDNAIEAAAQCQETDRWLNIYIYSVKNMFFIEIENSCCTLAKQKKGKFVTSKKNADMHGIGLASVQGVVDKYGGEMNFDYDRNHFKVMLDFFSDGKEVK